MYYDWYYTKTKVEIILIMDILALLVRNCRQIRKFFRLNNHYKKNENTVDFTTMADSRGGFFFLLLIILCRLLASSAVYTAPLFYRCFIMYTRTGIAVVFTFAFFFWFFQLVGYFLWYDFFFLA